MHWMLNLLAEIFRDDGVLAVRVVGVKETVVDVPLGAEAPDIASAHPVGAPDAGAVVIAARHDGAAIGGD